MVHSHKHHVLEEVKIRTVYGRPWHFGALGQLKMEGPRTGPRDGKKQSLLTSHSYSFSAKRWYRGERREILKHFLKSFRLATTKDEIWVPSLPQEFGFLQMLSWWISTFWLWQTNSLIVFSAISSRIFSFFGLLSSVSWWICYKEKLFLYKRH